MRPAENEMNRCFSSEFKEMSMNMARYPDILAASETIIIRFSFYWIVQWMERTPWAALSNTARIIIPFAIFSWMAPRPSNHRSLTDENERQLR
jgi:hypothetical protein